MIVRADSKFLKWFLIAVNPTPRLPCLAPFIWVMAVRVGEDCRTFVKIGLRP